MIFAAFFAALINNDKRMRATLKRRQELATLVPESMPVTRQWLASQNASLNRHAIDNLVKSGQLISLAHGVYMRPGTTLTWEGLVCFLQNVLQSDLIVGGLTALELRGLGHYAALSGRNVVYLYGKALLPQWINNILPSVKFVRHVPLLSYNRLNPRACGLVKDEYDPGLKKLYSGVPPSESRQKRTWTFTQSSPERAYLEILMDVPDTISFEHADLIMQGLGTLSPHRLDNVLRKTQSVKVRRLFYWFAERHQHAWFKKLPDPHVLDDLGLGAGKRVLAKGGKLDTKYNITIPEEMWTNTAYTTNKSSF